MQLAYLLIAVLFAVFFAFRNAAEWQDRQRNYKQASLDKKYSRQWHRWQFGVQLLFALSIGLTQQDWWHMLFGFLMTGAIFWLVFDMLLNKLCDRHPLYLSDSGIDRILRKIGIFGALVMKLILCVLTITWYFKNPF